MSATAPPTAPAIAFCPISCPVISAATACLSAFINALTVVGLTVFGKRLAMFLFISFNVFGIILEDSTPGIPAVKLLAATVAVIFLTTSSGGAPLANCAAAFIPTCCVNVKLGFPVTYAE